MSSEVLPRSAAGPAGPAPEEDAMTLFRAGVRSEVSRYYYGRRLGAFLAWHNNVDPGEIPRRAAERSKWTEKLAVEFARQAKENPKWAEGRVLAYILHLLERVQRGELSPHTVDTYKKPVKLFLDMNDITGLNWKRINKILPGGDAVADDRAYTLEEVRALAGDTDPRFRAAILLFATSGIRGGAQKELKVGHLEAVERGGQVVAVRVQVYAGSRERERYTAYATPEFWQEYQRYLEMRRKAGEEVGPESPAFALERLRPGRGRGSVVMDGSVLRSMLDVRLRRLGFREGTTGRSGKGEKRHEVAILHGFRKFFETQCLRAGLTPYTIDILLGHHAGLHQDYDRRGADDLLDEYLNAAPRLAILAPQSPPEEGGRSWPWRSGSGPWRPSWRRCRPSWGGPQRPSAAPAAPRSPGRWAPIRRRSRASAQEAARVQSHARPDGAVWHLWGT